MIRALLCLLLLVALLGPDPFAEARIADQVRSGTLALDTIRDELTRAGMHDPFVPAPLREYPQLPAGVLEHDGPLTPARVALGRQLFFDKRLSLDGGRSCASCHDPEHDYAAPERRHLEDGPAPSLLDLALESTPSAPFQGRILDALRNGCCPDPRRAAEELGAVEGYAMQFEAIFDGPVTGHEVVSALAAYQLTLISGPAAHDYHLAARRAHDPEHLESVDGDPGALREVSRLLDLREDHRMSALAEQGFELFHGEAGCVACHHGPNLRDGQLHAVTELHRVALGAPPRRVATPGLRRVAARAAYMHDARHTTLAQVVAEHAPTIGGQPVELEAAAKEALTAYLKEGFRSSTPRLELPRLP